MATDLRFRFDFSLTRSRNLEGGDGMTPAQVARALRLAREGKAAVDRRHAAGEVGFPDLPFRTAECTRIERRAEALRKKFKAMLVLGIGGSALGTKAVDEAVGAPARRRGMRLAVADNVDPDTLFPLLRSFRMEETVVVAISKSGGTAETNSQLALAIEGLRKCFGEKWRSRLILVTDPARGIFRKMADAEGIETFPVPPNVGGRFSVLSPVGLLPLAAAGVPLKDLLAGARWMEERIRTLKGDGNPALAAAAVYAHYLRANPKPVQVWFAYGAGLDRVSEWWQQLWGESLGKRRLDGVRVGQTPARATGVTDQHSQLQLYQDGPADKIFTFLKWMEGVETGNVPRAGFSPDMAMLGGRPLRDLFEAEFEGTIGALWEAGRPIVRMEIGRRDAAHVGAFLHLWEWITAIVGSCAGIDPFDQPGVEEGKKIAKAIMGEKGSESRRKAFLAAAARIAPAEIRFGAAKA